MKDYRKKFRDYYGIDFGRGYEIHHIDLNHGNNEISNLLLLPKSLHHRYHFYLTSCRMSDGCTDVQFDAVLSHQIIGPYALGALRGLLKAIEECSFWVECKRSGYVNPDGTKMIFS